MITVRITADAWSVGETIYHRVFCSGTFNRIVKIDVSEKCEKFFLFGVLKRDAEAVRGAWYFGATVTIAWIVGAAGLSLAWLLLVLAIAGTIVKTRFTRLLHTSVQHELARLRRRRALYMDETAEWLSLLVNRW